MPTLLLWRDLHLAVRRGGGVAAVLAFALMAIATFAFALGAEALATHIAPVALVVVVLACLLALPGVFERDEEDGSLEQMVLQPGALEWCVAAKIFAFWLTAALPLCALALLAAYALAGEGAGAGTLALSLLLATPTMAAVGVLGAALTVGLRRGGFTQALVVLPFYVPPLIFAAAGAHGVLAGMALVALPLACLAGAGLLRFAI